MYILYLRIYRTTKAKGKTSKKSETQRKVTDGKEEDAVFSRSGIHRSKARKKGQDSVRKGGRYIERGKIGVGQKKICRKREGVS